jgi:hypothetical protein
VAYQLCYTLPRWRTLVGAHLEAGATSVPHALALLALFGAAYNVHSFVQVRPKPFVLNPNLKPRRCWTSLLLPTTCEATHKGLTPNPRQRAPYSARNISQIRCVQASKE